MDDNGVGILSYRVDQVEKKVEELKAAVGVISCEVSQSKTDIAVLVKAVQDNTNALNDSSEKRFNWINLLLPVAVTIVIFVGQYLSSQNNQKVQQEIARSNTEMIAQVKQLMEASK